MWPLAPQGAAQDRFLGLPPLVSSAPFWHVPICSFSAPLIPYKEGQANCTVPIV